MSDKAKSFLIMNKKKHVLANVYYYSLVIYFKH